MADTSRVNDAMTVQLFVFALQLWPSAPISALKRRLETWPIGYRPQAQA